MRSHDQQISALPFRHANDVLVGTPQDHETLHAETRLPRVHHQPVELGLCRRSRARFEFLPDPGRYVRILDDWRDDAEHVKHEQFSSIRLRQVDGLRAAALERAA